MGSVPPSKLKGAAKGCREGRVLKIGQRSHKQKKGLFQERSPSFGDKKVLVGGLLLIFLWGMDRTRLTDYLIGADQKIPD